MGSSSNRFSIFVPDEENGVQEGNSVNDLTGFKAGKTLGKLARGEDVALLVVGRHRAVPRFREQNILEGSSLTSLSGAEGTGASSDD